MISSGGPCSYHNEYMYKGPGVIVGRKGSLGSVYWSHGPYWPHDTTLWVRDFKENDPKFIYYFLQTLELQRFDVGASNPTLNRNHLHRIEVKIPSLATQNRIATALSVFDDLIDNNRQRIELLEEMARLLYREWFVDFRFPGHEDVEWVDSELGPIPEGWLAGRFSDLVTEITDTIHPEHIAEGTPVVGLEHLPRRSVTLHEWESAADVGSRRKVFIEGDILFGKIRPYFHKVVDASISGCSSTDAIVFRPKKDLLRSRALAVASSDEFVRVATATSNGTKMPRANSKILMTYGISHPTEDVERAFRQTVGPMDSFRKILAAQNRMLREARDLLLPRLVSGELDVSELDMDLMPV